ncbi:predicted protein [Chaetomium globosum CBS 148.51]|uniref:Uncharacterized protein n=1 Tax=Chaetomium globosum (strain ATCC 6205 / CBS 148.51 / DSM 1962 / NBRC 6347 / NRRL 1970) TaxID=306901 RepID=Q2GVJ7_CHAGB|nr:uncharacterized protein CHGG_08007 [Chaetomium globosum CBS 148.51]EAQ86754.1 predicted protein [Chaetomium globosum CBS 148.51]
MERRGRCIEFRLSAFVDELRTRRCLDVLCVECGVHKAFATGANKMETQIQLDARCTQAPRNDETGAPRPIGPAAARDAEMSPAEWPAKVHSQVQPCGGGFRPQAFDWLVWRVKHVETSGPRGRPSVVFRCIPIRILRRRKQWQGWYQMRYEVRKNPEVAGQNPTRFTQYPGRMANIGREVPEYECILIDEALCGLLGPCTARHAGCERLISMAPVRYHWVVPSTAMCADRWCITKG